MFLFTVPRICLLVPKRGLYVITALYAPRPAVSASPGSLLETNAQAPSQTYWLWISAGELTNLYLVGAVRRVISLGVRVSVRRGFVLAYTFFSHFLKANLKEWVVVFTCTIYMRGEKTVLSCCQPLFHVAREEAAGKLSIALGEKNAWARFPCVLFRVFD